MRTHGSQRSPIRCNRAVQRPRLVMMLITLDATCHVGSIGRGLEESQQSWAVQHHAACRGLGDLALVHCCLLQVRFVILQSGDCEVKPISVPYRAGAVCKTTKRAWLPARIASCPRLCKRHNALAVGIRGSARHACPTSKSRDCHTHHSEHECSCGAAILFALTYVSRGNSTSTA